MERGACRVHRFIHGFIFTTSMYVHGGHAMMRLACAVVTKQEQAQMQPNNINIYITYIYMHIYICMQHHIALLTERTVAASDLSTAIAEGGMEDITTRGDLQQGVHITTPFNKPYITVCGSIGCAPTQ